MLRLFERRFELRLVNPSAGPGNPGAGSGNPADPPALSRPHRRRCVPAPFLTARSV